MIAVNMFERGKTCGEIAQDLRADDQTVRHWKRVWKERGRVGLKSKPHPGRPCILQETQKQELVQMLRQPPTEHGFTRHFWTTQMIAELIRKRFDVSYDNDWVGQMLHALGFSWQKPMRRARERDEKRIAGWRQDIWPDVVKKTPRPTA